MWRRHCLDCVWSFRLCKKRKTANVDEENREKRADLSLIVFGTGSVVELISHRAQINVFY